MCTTLYQHTDRPNIVHHIKNNKGNKIATLIAVLEEDNTVLIGFSKCKLWADKFDKQIGTDIALTRAYKWKHRYLGDADESEDKGVIVPYSLAYELYKFVMRCERYFKNATKYSTWIHNLLEDQSLHDKYEEEQGLKFLVKRNAINNIASRSHCGVIIVTPIKKDNGPLINPIYSKKGCSKGCNPPCNPCSC